MTVIPMDDSPPALAPRAAPVTGAMLTLGFGLLLGLGVQGGVLLAMALRRDRDVIRRRVGSIPDTLRDEWANLSARLDAARG